MRADNRINAQVTAWTSVGMWIEPQEVLNHSGLQWTETQADHGFPNWTIETTLVVPESLTQELPTFSIWSSDDAINRGFLDTSSMILDYQFQIFTDRGIFPVQGKVPVVLSPLTAMLDSITDSMTDTNPQSGDSQTRLD